MKGIYAIAAVVVALVIALFVWRRSGEGHERPMVARAHEQEAAATAGAHEAIAVAEGPSRLRRITPEQRKRIAAEIAVAQSARARGWKGGAPAGSDEEAPENDIDLEHTPMPVKDALEASIPLLAECYKDRPDAPKRPAVNLTLAGDPTIGTLVTPDTMVDAEGKPLPADLDHCLRATLESLELPPLDAGAKLSIQYSFRFD